MLDAVVIAFYRREQMEQFQLFLATDRALAVLFPFGHESKVKVALVVISVVNSVHVRERLCIRACVA